LLRFRRTAVGLMPDQGRVGPVGFDRMGLWTAVIRRLGMKWTKVDLGHDHWLYARGDELVLWHPHRQTGFPCGILLGLERGADDEPISSPWIRCPTCQDLGKIEGGHWIDEGRLATVVDPSGKSYQDLVLAVPV
jgi:hypothetical protein